MSNESQNVKPGPNWDACMEAYRRQIQFFQTLVDSTKTPGELASVLDTAPNIARLPQCQEFYPKTNS